MTIFSINTFVEALPEELNDDSLITEASLVAVEDGPGTCPLIVLLEELLMLWMFDVVRVEVDVADVSDVSQPSPGGVQLVDVCQVWLGGVPLPETRVELSRSEIRIEDHEVSKVR